MSSTLDKHPPAALRRTSPLDARLAATHDRFLAERPAGSDEDVHMIAEIVDHVIKRCTSPGALVCDPFAGFGTTIARAAALGRRGLGIELLPERVAYLSQRSPDARIIEGDAREMLRLLSPVLAREQGAPHADLILTSPPYMTAQDHTADPLTAYELDTGNYERYLAELGLVAAQCARVVRPGGYVVWNVADIVHRGHRTPLITDCARVLREHLTELEVTEISWDRLPHDLVADALLVFRRPL